MTTTTAPTKPPTKSNADQRKEVKAAKRAAIVLPTLTVGDAAAPMPTRSFAANPLTENVKTANTNRGSSYDVAPVDSQPVADKVIRLLQAAARELGCGVRCTYIPSEKVVRFQARDAYTRKPAAAK